MKKACVFTTRLFDSTFFECFLSMLEKGVGLLLGRRASLHFQDKIISFFALPSSRLGIQENLHVHLLKMRLETKAHPRKRAVKEMPRNHQGPLRLGLAGRISTTLWRQTTEPSTFTKNNELHVFDCTDAVPSASAGIGEVSFYKSYVFDDLPLHQIDRSPKGRAYWDQMNALAKDINDARLDLLVLGHNNIFFKNDLVQLLNTPCIVNNTSGRHPSGHPNVDYEFPMAKYDLFYFQSGRRFSKLTGRPLRCEYAYDAVSRVLFTPFSVNKSVRIPLKQRPKALLWHGALYKLFSEEFLSVIARLLQDDPTLKFNFLGNGSCLNGIMNFFRKKEVDHQVTYCGYTEKSSFESFHDKISDFLTRGQIWIDSFPNIGGRSVYEAFRAGVPVVTLDLYTPMNVPIVWDKYKLRYYCSIITQDCLTCAKDIEEYVSCCKRLLSDSSWAQEVVQRQDEIAKRTVDADSWWGEVFDSYHHWLHGTGWASEIGPVGGRLTSDKQGSKQ